MINCFKKIYNFYLLCFILCEPNFLGIINSLFPGSYYLLFGFPFMSFFSLQSLLYSFAIFFLIYHSPSIFESFFMHNINFIYHP